MNERNSTLQVRLRSAIERTGKSLKEFCAQTDIPYRTLQNYLAGDRLPGAEALTAMARAGINVNWLLSGEEVAWPHEEPQMLFHALMNIGEISSDDNLIKKIAEAGLLEDILKEACDRTDSLNKKYIEESGSSYGVVELINSLEIYCGDIISGVRNAINIIEGSSPSMRDKLPDMPRDILMKVVADLLNNELGGRANNKVYNFLSSLGKGASLSREIKAESSSGER